MTLAAARAFLPLASAAAAPLAGAGLSAAGKAVAQAKDVAKDFEAMLLSELLKQSRKTLGKDGGFFGEDKADTHGALFDFFLGKHLADSGGIGVAASVQRQIPANK